MSIKNHLFALLLIAGITAALLASPAFRFPEFAVLLAKSAVALAMSSLALRSLAVRLNKQHT